MHRKKEGLTLWEKVKNILFFKYIFTIFTSLHLTSQSPYLSIITSLPGYWGWSTIIFCKFGLEFGILFCELLVPKLSKNTWRHVVRTSPVPPPHKKKLRVVHIIPHLNSNLTQMMVSSMTRTEISMHQCFLHYSAPVGRILLPQQWLQMVFFDWKGTYNTTTWQLYTPNFPLSEGVFFARTHWV